MASVYTGIYLRLKGSKTPWKDKLKLAHFAWISPLCFLPNKEQVLLDWVSYSLSGYYSKKLDLEQDIIEGLWTYLEDMLYSSKLQNLFKKGKAVTLRFTLAQAINESLSVCASSSAPLFISNVLSCCKNILSSSVLSIVYTAKIQLMVDLLSKLTILACSDLKHQHVVLNVNLFEVLLLVLNKFQILLKQQTNPNRTFGLVTSQLLQPCLLLRYLLTSRKWTTDDDTTLRNHLSKNICSEIFALLQYGIFSFEHLSSFKKEFQLMQTEAPKEKNSTSSKNLLNPLSVILQKITDDQFSDQSLHFSVRTSSVPLLYKMSLESFCVNEENHILLFHILARFVLSMRLSHGGTETLSGVEWSQALLALESLLNSALTCDIYNVAVDRLQHEETQFHFYTEIAQLLLKHPQPDCPAWYRCLKTFVLLNHLIVEPSLNELLYSGWISVDCIDDQVKNAQNDLLCTLFQTYAKLRQLTNIFEVVILLICQHLPNEPKQLLFSDVFLKKLCECIFELPTNQVLDICNLMLQKCKTSLIPHLEGNKSIALKLFLVSSTLHSVLFSMKSLDNTTPLPLVQRTNDLLRRMFDDTIRPLILILQTSNVSNKKWFKKSYEAMLLMLYTRTEIIIVFQMHCVKFASLVNPYEKFKESANVSCSFFSDIPTETSLCLFRAAQHCGPMSQLLLELLTIQKIKQNLLHVEIRNNSEILLKTQEAVTFVVKSGGSSLKLKNNELWCGQISNVDANTFPAAHWLLVVSNLSLISPFLSRDDLIDTADVLLNTVLFNDPLIDTQYGDLALSVPVISKQFLASGQLIEMPELHSAFIGCLIKRFHSLLGVKANPVLQCLTEKELKWSTFQKYIKDDTGMIGELEELWKTLELAAQEIQRLFGTGFRLTLPDKHLATFVHLLQMTASINPDGMTSADHSRCFLILLFIVLSVEPSCKGMVANTIKILSNAYTCLTFLLAGRNINYIFRIMHASDILEMVMTSVFSLVSCSFFASDDYMQVFDFFHKVQNFLSEMLNIVIERKSSIQINMEKIAAFVLNCETASKLTSGEHLDSVKPAASRFLLIILTTVSQVVNSHFSLLNKNSPIAETFICLHEKIALVHAPVIESFLKTMQCHKQDQVLMINSVTGLIEAERNCLSHKATAESSKPLTTLQFSSLYESYNQHILKELCSSEQPLEFIRSALSFMKAFYLANIENGEEEMDAVIISYLQNLKELLSAPWITLSSVENLELHLKELITVLTENCSTSQFYVILHMIIEDLEVGNIWKQSHRIVWSGVTLTRLLVSCPLAEGNSKVFWRTVPQLLTALVFLIKESSRDLSLISNITVPALVTVSNLLRQGEGRLGNPHSVTQAFSALILVPLDNITTEEYYNVFHAIHEVLFSVIYCHPKVMLKAASSFLNCFYRLVVSVINEGQKNNEGKKETSHMLDVIVKCARLVQRMYTHIASRIEEFTVLSSFIVAQYVSSLQKVTLHPEVKNHLTEGIYHILDLCIGPDIKFLNATLCAGVKEVFRNLYNDYTNCHKSQRQGEDRYTA
ncbi:unhealthy ribosome biogenesis protein 2 homolog isoform X1 [Polypterus senegalus]|uniref:unhealthy ribosome biogenesis protein 2 homolog isoform X1 n=1 Tax=Polypterus senegalus TaxID=55291 RepID=UPI001965EB56|nr:unhealthy ribosome biogenesis protein 2 homolog isoform X1 [Polypterus senegalus]XP_039604218.1 unhealthy ribosome biogenesis protein 2 homolog isoform X1 [Polypterus senegalus]XP_039604219.1 unhealthy ribosome biogenesis protein 2 homolog isoform X1 [Polypterus senegalus]